MNSILNVTVSKFSKIEKTSGPQFINLLQWLTSEDHKDHAQYIRSISDKKKRDEEKGKLPVITPAGEFYYRQSCEENIKSYSGLLAFDIDQDKNMHIQNCADLKEQVSRFKEVAYCGLSASGTGIWGLIPIAYPKTHYKQHFEFVYNSFKSFGIILDKAPSSIVSARFYSYDPDAYFNHNAALLTAFEKLPTPKQSVFIDRTSVLSEKALVEICLNEIQRRNIDITPGYKEDWLAIGCNFASTFGEAGRDYFILVSQFHHEYNYLKTSRQYDQCLKYATGQPASLSVFFDRCKRANIMYRETEAYKNLISNKQH